MVPAVNALPAALELFQGGLRQCIRFLFAALRGRQLLQIPEGGVDIDHIRHKSIQLRISEDRVLIILSVFRLVKNRLNALVQQKQLHHPDDVMGCGAAQYGDLFPNAGRAVREKLPAELFRFFQQFIRVKRIWNHLFSFVLAALFFTA